MAAVSSETHEHTRNSQSLNIFVPGITEEYITQDSEEIEGRVTKELCQEFSRIESRILDSLSKLDEFLLNPQTRTLSGTVPGTSRDDDLENREPTGDRFQSDTHPEVEFSTRRTSNLLTQTSRRPTTICFCNMFYHLNNLQDFSNNLRQGSYNWEFCYSFSIFLPLFVTTSIFSNFIKTHSLKSVKI